eukprot:12106509-Alexandrium_andersonii.AAC.1
MGTDQWDWGRAPARALPGRDARSWRMHRSGGTRRPRRSCSNSPASRSRPCEDRAREGRARI